MSDLMPHARSDLNELHLRTDCPECGHGRICSPGLCSRLHPPRTYLRAALETSLRRTERRAEVIVLSERRRVK